MVGRRWLYHPDAVDARNRLPNQARPLRPSDAYEAALRRLPEAHSLALRLKAAGVADEVVCGYLQIELLLAEAGGAWALL